MVHDKPGSVFRVSGGQLVARPTPLLATACITCMAGNKAGEVLVSQRMPVNGKEWQLRPVRIEVTANER